MSKASKEEVTEIKLKRAFQLIKEERYGAAHHILREFPDHPKAQAMMKMMEGKKEKRRGYAALTPRTVITFGAVITVFMILCGMCGVIGFYLSRYTADELFLIGAGSFGDGDAGLLAPALVYCKISQEWKAGACQEWPTIIFVTHYAAMETCFDPYRGMVFLNLDQVLAIRRCLRNFEAPATY